MNTNEDRLEIIRKACGYVGNGTSQPVTICQDDATGIWVMRAGFGTFSQRMEAYSEDGGFHGAIDAFGEKYKDSLE